jgi:hypothetical protein
MVAKWGSNFLFRLSNRTLLNEDAVGRWENFRVRPFDPLCKNWTILHKVDNSDQMRCGRSAGPSGFRVQGFGAVCWPHLLSPAVWHHADVLGRQG